MKEQNMTEIVYDYYASRIQFGYYAYGDRLPSMRYICGQFQVSTLTVHAALVKLCKEGYIRTAERKTALVIFQPDERTKQQYVNYFLSHWDGMDDICRFASLLFDPIAALYFREHDEASLNRIRTQLKKAAGHPARQITQFYAEAMLPLRNPLALNLYWEVVRYLRFPYLSQSADFNKMDTPAAEHIKRILALVQEKKSDRAVGEMEAFSRNTVWSFLQKLHLGFDLVKKTDQVPFHWHIYREHPQLCYTLAAEIMSRIDRQLYRPEEFLPSCQALAREYGVSLITMRRTLDLLGHMRITETLNGVGTRVVLQNNSDTPDFSHPQIQKSLILFLQAMQVSALTCRNVAIQTLSSLEPHALRELDEKIRQHAGARTIFLVVETCLRFIGENSPSPFIREVYRQLYHLQLWGHLLHMFFKRPEAILIYSEIAARLRQNLQNRDIHGFADLFSSFLFSVMDFTKSTLLKLGFEESRLIRGIPVDTAP